MKAYRGVAAFGFICIFLAIAGLLVPQNRSAPVDIASYALSSQAPLTLITEPEKGYTFIVDQIAQAQKSVDLVIYKIEDPKVLQALVDAHNRNISVRVMLEDITAFGKRPNQTAFDFLEQHHVPVAWSPNHFPLTHQKTLIFDSKRALLMTFNLTPQYYASSRDFAILDEDPSDVAAIQATFNSDWSKRKEITQIGNNLVWSPGSAQTLISLIASASTTLDIYNEEMADPRIVEALKEASARGVLVRVLMTYATSWKDELETLREAGVMVRTYASSAKLYIHAKLIIADTHTVFIGSENFSSQSLDRNRELGILLVRPDILSSLETTFEHDWQHARPFTH
ncbi:MAG: hypothetical protein QG621_554 [Patescibacteria group bacterium]|nr:hypothetical protein [Patescibacteria group bacterium]